MTDPYRAMVPLDPKPRHGLISASKPVKPHKCKTPLIGPLRFLFFWLPRIHRGSVWRCSECDKVFMGYDSWYESDINHWKQAGGVE